jgi:hypothetical protein
VSTDYLTRFDPLWRDAQREADAALVAFARESPVTLVDPKARLCTADACRIESAVKALFRDSNTCRWPAPSTWPIPWQVVSRTCAEAGAAEAAMQFAEPAPATGTHAAEGIGQAAATCAQRSRRTTRRQLAASSSRAGRGR